MDVTIENEESTIEKVEFKLVKRDLDSPATAVIKIIEQESTEQTLESPEPKEVSTKK